MSCNVLAVARKLQTTESSGVDAAIAAINLRMAKKQLGGLRVVRLARQIQVPIVRRRIPVTMFPEIACPVKIGHLPQNLDTGAIGIQPAQTQRV